ncbi:hypothetical protein TIFTF001_038719 [Ficus carica]|uniref:Uncharacterized protein n=1 Tax=Ficus carica TaxID=3494 RepID=A0AA88E894_FICCA|nr:hypothetical protein TIFTF001_038719 [Ficus carica]
MFIKLGHVPTVIVSSPKAAELFLKTNDALFASRPKVQASKYMSYGTKGMALNRVRSVLAEPEKTMHVTAPEKSSAASEIVDLSQKLGEISAGISCGMILGTNKSHSYCLKELVHEALCLMGTFNIADYVPFLEPFDLLKNPRERGGEKPRENQEKKLEKAKGGYGRAGVRKKGVKNFGAIWGARAECLESQKGGRFRFAYPNPSLGLAKGKSGLVGSQEGGVRKFGIQARLHGFMVGMFPISVQPVVACVHGDDPAWEVGALQFGIRAEFLPSSFTVLLPAPQF